MQVSQLPSNNLNFDTSRLRLTGETDHLSPEFGIDIDHSASEIPDAINSDANDCFVFKCFDMNIACTRLNRSGNDSLPSPNNHKVIILCSQINTVP